MNSKQALRQIVALPAEESAKRHAKKYASRNPVQRLVLGRFFRRLYSYFSQCNPKHVLDFGCGEAYFWSEMQKLGPIPPVTGIDVRPDALDIARRTFPQIRFVSDSIFRFESDDAFDLVLASQVLEHLTDPGRYLARLCELSSRWLILTVPHEPYFRLCNLARGRDLFRLGNHPEHVQQWSLTSFGRFARDFVNVRVLESAFPFIILVGEKE